MKRFIWMIAILLLSAMQALGEDQKRHASDYTRVLEVGPADQWADSVRALITDNGKMSSYAVASVLKRLPDMATAERIRIARGLKGKKNDPRAVAALVELSRDPEPRVKETAMDSLLYGHFPLAAQELMALLTPEETLRAKIIQKLTAVYVCEQNLARSRTKSGDFGPSMAGRESHEDARETLYLPAIAKMMDDDDAQVRQTAVRAAAHFIDGRVNDWLLAMSRDEDEAVRMAALWQLAARGDPRACDPLFQWAAEDQGEKESEKWRRRRFQDVGSYCADQLFIDYLEHYREAQTEAAIRYYLYLILGAAGLRRLDNPDLMQDIATYVDDPDPFIRSTAEKLLTWQHNRRKKAAIEEIKGSMRPMMLALAAVISAMFGVITFLWAFRLLHLRRFLKTAAVTKIRSLALGPVVLKGQAQPMNNQHLTHPDTGEPCLYYAGADRTHPRHRFYLEDDTGRVLVEPGQSIFLSEDDVLLPGESLHLIGAAQPEGTGTERIVVRKPNMVRTLYHRIGHWLVQGLVGGLARRGRAKIWFSDPANCFWLWDDACQPPFASDRGLLFTIVTLLVSGGWVLCFAISVLVMIDQSMGERFSQAIRTLLG